MSYKIKIGYLTIQNPFDKRSLTYYLRKSLERYFDVECITVNIPKIYKIAAYLFTKLTRKRHHPTRFKFFAKFSAYWVQKRIKKHNLSLIVAWAISEALAYLKIKIPIIYISDMTFKRALNYYEYFSGLSEFTVKNGEAFEKESIREAAICVFPSKWAAGSTLKDYNADPDKIFILPLGANTDPVPTKYAVAYKKKSKTLNLLFCGIDWQRKGGEIALETTEILNKKYNIKTKLFIMGARPPFILDTENTKIVGFLNKNDPEDFKKWYELFRDSHFLILPTRAEASGIVFAEASAFGLPSITTDTGGVSAMVKNGVNGYRLNYSDGPLKYAKLIAGIWTNKTKYVNLVFSSRNFFEMELNWNCYVQKLIHILKKKNLLQKNYGYTKEKQIKNSYSSTPLKLLYRWRRNSTT